MTQDSIRTNGDELLEKEHPLWKRDHIELKSVGIDIGSSTSHLVFSTLELRRQGAALSSRFQVASRRIDYESPIIITPFINGTSIDTEKLSAFFDAAYKESGFKPDDIDTGAVITTGDAARKDNAEAIIKMFSEQAGKFVCASAGPVLEAKMAAYGSGAVARSTNGSEPLTVLNIDIGGGTAKLAIARDGAILETAAMNVGARLITFEKDGMVTNVEKAADIVSQHRGLGIRVGERISDETKQRLSLELTKALMEVASRRPLSKLTSELLVTAPLIYTGPVDVMMFSGGVSEFLYKRDVGDYGDLGLHLGREIKKQAAEILPQIPVEIPLQYIRATVIGASQYTVQVSGNTIFIANPDLLPLRNLRAVAVRFKESDLNAKGVARAITEALHKADVEEGEDRIALAIHWPWGPAYSLLQALCQGIAGALKHTIKKREPVMLVLDSDLAKLVGSNLSGELGNYNDLICIDGVQLQDMDFVDIGREHPDAHVVTVVIKSLVFSG